MYSPIQSAIKYLSYYFNASSNKGHGIHSPFIFDFITKVLNDKITYPEYTLVESLRKELEADKTILEIRDLGAGSRTNKKNGRLVSSILKSSVKSKKYSQLLFRMARYYKTQTILELGTSLGITSSYLSLAVPHGKIITTEGAEQVAQKAGQNFSKLGLGNINLIIGEFDNVLPGILEKQDLFDLVFIDGNHRKEPTLKYFNSLLPKIHKDSILVFDDIHWSSEMEMAWEIIRDHDSVRCSIDLFFLGILFFRSEFREKQEFTLRY